MRQHRYTGELLMIVSIIGFTLMQSFARYLGPAVGSWTKTFYRCVFTCVFTLLWMLLRREPIRLNNRWLLLLRGLSGAIAITCFFWAIDLLDLLRATLYTYSHVFFAILFSAILFKERLVWWMIFPLAAAMAGLYLIVDPAIDGFSAGDLVGLCTTLFSGLGRACVRELRRTDSPANVVLVFMLCGVALTGVGILLIPGQSFTFSPSPDFSISRIWLVLLAIGLTSGAASILMTTAFRRLTTTVGSIMALMVLPLTAVIAVLYFQESLTVGRVVGGVLILAAGTVISLFRPAATGTQRP